MLLSTVFFHFNHFVKAPSAATGDGTVFAVSISHEDKICQQKKKNPPVKQRVIKTRLKNTST